MTYEYLFFRALCCGDASEETGSTPSAPFFSFTPLCRTGYQCSNGCQNFLIGWNSFITTIEACEQQALWNKTKSARFQRAAKKTEKFFFRDDPPKLLLSCQRFSHHNLPLRLQAKAVGAFHWDRRKESESTPSNASMARLVKGTANSSAGTCCPGSV